MKESLFKSYDELPLFLNASTVAKALGVSPSTGYELMHEKGFPALRIGNRIVVPKEKFQQWVDENTVQWYEVKKCERKNSRKIQGKQQG